MQTIIDSFTTLNYTLIFGLGASGIIMALLSSLVGMKAKVENPLWWLLYAIWILIVLKLKVISPFYTILTASFIAGLLHSLTQSILIDRYIENNPWYADKMKSPKSKIRMMFVVMGVVIGLGFGAIVGGIAHWIS